jgi:hypothetical protein
MRTLIISLAVAAITDAAAPALAQSSPCTTRWS